MRVMVVEDEAIVARRLVRLIRRILGETLTGLEVAPSLARARDALERTPPDLVFLDLNLNGRDGFRLLTEATACAFQTIVVSAHDQAAIRAFEHGVTDFVAKPFGEDRLALAIARARERWEERPAALRYLMVRRSGDLVPVAIEHLRYIRGAGDYSELCGDDGDQFLHDKSLTTLTRLLPPAWRRIHRSYLVDEGRIARYRSQPGSRYFAVLTSGEELPVSRTFMRRIRGAAPRRAATTPGDSDQ